jgi:hypothetical protein
MVLFFLSEAIMASEPMPVTAVKALVKRETLVPFALRQRTVSPSADRATFPP